MEPIEMAAEFGVWTQVVDSAAFSPRDTAEDLVYDGRMWLSNGYYHGDVLTRDLWSSSDGVTWDLVNDATPYDGYSEMAVYDNKMWAVKGSGADIWHSVDGVEWTLVMESAPYGNRTAAAVVVFGGKLWVMGGYIESTNQPPEQGYPQFTTFNDVWCSADGLNWTRVLEQAPWAKRMWFIARAYGDRIWIVGGYDNVHAKNFGDVWYSEDGVTWQPIVCETMFSPRHEPTCYVYDDTLWVVAGNAWPVQNDVWCLRPAPAD